VAIKFDLQIFMKLQYVDSFLQLIYQNKYHKNYKVY